MWLIGSIVLTQVLLLVFLGWVFLKVRSLSWDIADKIHEYEELIAGLFKPQGDKPSKLVDFFDAMSAMLATRLIASAEAAIKGSAGGAARAEHAAQLAGNPMAGLLSGKLGKNPLVGLIMQTVLDKFGNKEAGTSVVPSNGSSPKFRL